MPLRPRSSDANSPASSADSGLCGCASDGDDEGDDACEQAHGFDFEPERTDDGEETGVVPAETPSDVTEQTDAAQPIAADTTEREAHAGARDPDVPLAPADGVVVPVSCTDACQDAVADRSDGQEATLVCVGIVADPYGWFFRCTECGQQYYAAVRVSRVGADTSVPDDIGADGLSQ
jgi:hypothetical protein